MTWGAEGKYLRVEEVAGWKRETGKGKRGSGGYEVITEAGNGRGCERWKVSCGKNDSKKVFRMLEISHKGEKDS